MTAESAPDLTPEALAFIGTSDLAGLLRGKSIPLAALARRMASGVGITHSHRMLSPFGPIRKPNFVAILTCSRKGARASPTSSSFFHGP